MEGGKEGMIPRVETKKVSLNLGVMKGLISMRAVMVLAMKMDVYEFKEWRKWVFLGIKIKKGEVKGICLG